MGGRHARGLKSIVSTSIPAVNPRARAFEPYIKRLDFYRAFLEFLGDSESFHDIAGEVYFTLLDGRTVKERKYQQTIDALEWEAKKKITEIIFEMKSSGEDQFAKILEKYINEDDLYSAYEVLIERNRDMVSRLELYKLILEFFKAETVFTTVSRQVYGSVRAPRYVPATLFSRVERILRAECTKRIERRLKELRTSALGREADKIEEYLAAGDLENAYLTLKGITNVKKIEAEKVDAQNFMARYLETSSLLSTLEIAGVDVSEIRWKLAELLGPTLTGVPEEKLVLVNDPYGNFGCFLSLFMKRIGVKHTYFSSSGSGDFWITNAEVKNRINPNLQASDLGERILESKDVVILEDLNYLILNNKFSEVYRFLYYIKSNAKSRIVATLNMKLLSDKERARLKGIANKVMDSKFLLNVCSTNIVAINERPTRGALLLAKELAEDFEGNVYMIADFGGEKYLHPQRIDFEILDKISEHIEKGDVVIDALDMLIDENSIEKIYLWLKFLKDLARLKGHRVYVVTRDLIESEREYIRPLVDFDLMLIGEIDQKRLGKIQAEISAIKRNLEKMIEKECLYNIEIIKHRYEDFKNYLSDFEEDIEKIQSIKNFDYHCLITTAPIRKRIEERIEEIERIIAEFNDIARELKSLIPIFRVYTDTKALEKCVADSEALLASGNHTGALESIKECNASLNKYYRAALSRAWALRKELLCVGYLLPPYHREKVEEFEGDREKLKDFTLLLISLKTLVRRKIEMEYHLLQEYSAISGVELFELPDIESGNYCEYRRLRDKFMEDFEKIKPQVMERIKSNIIPAVEFLLGRGYALKINPGDVQKISRIEEILDVKNRVAHHLVRYANNYFEKMRELCPLCVENVDFDLEKFSQAPLEMLDSLKSVIQDLDEKMLREEKELMKITDEIKGYYAAFIEHGVNFEEKYPRNIREGREILKNLEIIAESVVPILTINLVKWNVDESRTISMTITVKNISKYPAKNITFEFHGVFSKRVDAGTLGGGEMKILQIEGEIRDVNNAVNVDMIYESIIGKISIKSVKFEINVAGYTLKKSSGSEKCALCRGKIFRDTDMVICSNCGAMYHYQCAKRSGKCNVCGHVFLFE
ncbi:MAG: DUF835 domain-containing protein [Euryarchaeota archaeon]|nr:DUF835 domain-containing protein [Euryarchaeota archaeon]